MKILLVHNKYKSRFVGGEDVVFRNELEALKEKMGSENVFEYTVANDDLNKLGLIFSIWFSKKHYKNIYNLVKDSKIDLVHVHNFFPLLTPSVFKAAKKAGAKVVNTLHNYRWWCLSGIFYRDKKGICELCAKKKFASWGIFYRCYRRSFLQSFLAALAFYFYKLIKVEKFIDYFFVLTNFEKEKIKELGINKEKIILKPNFTNELLSTPIESRKDYIFVGKLDESKGIDFLLNVWQNLGSEYVLKIVGSGESDSRLLQYKRDNIIFLGKIDNSETKREITQSKYLIQSSLMYETSGLTILEAFSAGVPVIGFNIGTRKDFIEDGINGFLANKDNLIEVIKRSYEFNDYSSLVNGAKDSIRKFEKNKVIDEQILIYKNIIKV